MSLREKVQQQTASSRFRHDINALRAVAFLAVLFYHFGIPGFQGGFAGVDIFLVISGYLIYSLLSPDSGRRQPGVLEFFSRRVARLIGPIVAVVLACLGIGTLFLDPRSLTALSESSISAVSFVSNIYFWRDIDYFNPESATRFLLHTWSLSLEVQFYLIFPLILIGLRFVFRTKTALAAALFMVFAASFLLAVYLSGLKPIPSFYLLPTRLWEFLLGALVFEAGTFRQDRRTLLLPQVVGVLLILFSVTLVSKDVAWPGYYTLLPTVGTALVIYSSTGREAVFSTPPLRFFGVISYSGYLWHWPVVVLLIIFEQIGNPAMVGLGLLAALLFGTLSWAGIERTVAPVLYGFPAFKRTGVLIGAVSVIAIVPASIIALNGLAGRFTEDKLAFFETGYDGPSVKRCSELVLENCVVDGVGADIGTDGSSVGAVVIGDSHAGMIAQAVSDTLPRGRSRVALYSLGACPTISDISMALNGTDSCRNVLHRVFELLETKRNLPVFVANRYSFYVSGFNESKRGASPNYFISERHSDWTEQYRQEILTGYEKTLCEISNHGRVIVLAPFPEFRYRVSDRISRDIVLRDSFEMPVLTADQYAERNRHVIAMLTRVAERCNVEVLDPIPGLCPTGVCYGADDGGIIYSDSNHLSGYGASYLTRVFAELVDRGVVQAGN